ncbi:hypothetical protein [Providencia rettgeri]|uniref:hypothetical protein n=1 Tax=Providencia rettgeri TaxID=587 RepID=UPI0025731A17|nr:hypothetical protein [Providencia rettgeri]MDL9989462.1 hypothetical protein [Providencia rettgeri]
MSFFNIISGIFKKKNTHENKLPTVKCNVGDFLSAEDVIKALIPIKEKYKKLTFSDDEMVSSILSGWRMDLASISLRNLNHDITQTEIIGITSWLSSKCHYLYDSRRSISLGITEGEWISSGCCGYKGRDNSHLKFNGKKFKLKNGLIYRGKPYYPGGEEYCRCGYKSILPF